MTLRPLRAAVASWKPGLGVAADPLQAIATAWPTIVGDHVAGHSAPIDLMGSTLLIAVRTSAWSQQLHFLSETILAGVRALPAGARVSRVTFRVAALREEPERRRSPERVTTALRRDERVAPAPAVDAAEALERLRERLRRARRNGAVRCERCGSALAAPTAAITCAPCTGRAAAERALAVERLLFLCPWFEPDAVREQVPDLGPGEVERIRRRLLQRWWLVLERARRAGRLSRSGIERSIASSYVLLQSRLPPDRITPAVVRNLLGPELERLLWPGASP